MANSFSQWVNAWGKSDFVITHPEDYELDPHIHKRRHHYASTRMRHLKDADFVYVKNWSTYNDYGKIYTNDPEWMLTNEKLKLTNHAKVMHCLPVRRNVELSDEVLDGPHSIVTQQAGNRVWAAQAVLSEYPSIQILTHGDLYVIKIGGNIIDDESALSSFPE